MSKKISGAEYPLAKIFSSDFDYQIPTYQRPYAWTVDEASELFDDLYDFYLREQEETYFLGSIVLIKDEGAPLSQVIDGQQRLTTLTILLAAITSMLSGSLRSDFENYISEPGRASQGLKPKARLALRDRDKDFFAKYVQGILFDDLFVLNSAMLNNESQRNIQANSKLLIERLNASFAGDSGKICEFGAFLVQRCFLVAVSTPSQNSAFRVFSVLNSRGLDLLPTDIIKADVIGKIPQSIQELYTDRWEELEVQTGRSGFNELFGHIRMIYVKAKAKKTLLEEFRSLVIPQVASSEDLIEKVIEPYADAYSIVKNIKYTSTNNAQEVNELITWLNRIDNSDWVPSAIYFLSQQKNDPKYVLWFFQRLERLAAYLHICAKNVNQRIERYSKILFALEGQHSGTNHINAIELTADEKLEMKDTINGKIYDLIPRRRNYLILRLDSFLACGSATYDSTTLTIEHVLPQNVPVGSQWEQLWPDDNIRKIWVHRIANLVPLMQKKNSSAQNYDFAKKKVSYFTGPQGVSSYALTTQVLNTNNWTEQIVQVRQKDLMDAMIKGWELN
ncbi:MAG: DUF262 domain-containing HNH endonuclease family protein [bacterium]